VIFLVRYPARSAQANRCKTHSPALSGSDARISKRGDKYDERICPAYDWYRELAGLAQALVKAREEIQAKSVPEVTPPEPQAEPATASEQSQLPNPLFCKMPCQPIHLVAPLTPETVETLRHAAEHGLLIGSEHTLFTQPAAA